MWTEEDSGTIAGAGGAGDDVGAVGQGFFEGEVLDVAGVQRLSTMPGKPELQSTLLMTFLAAPTDFVKQLAAGPQEFVYLLDARKRNLENA